MRRASAFSFQGSGATRLIGKPIGLSSRLPRHRGSMTATLAEVPVEARPALFDSEIGIVAARLAWDQKAEVRFFHLRPQTTTNYDSFTTLGSPKRRKVRTVNPVHWKHRGRESCPNDHFPGGMAERLNAPVLKTDGPLGLGGSNPSPSANFANFSNFANFDNTQRRGARNGNGTGC